ncbi:MAG: alpha/beta hydrolase [Oscillospiraceae bacterium]|nr:alpha/beta hydrolase [Oscillospiraceae bacterium]
MKKYLLPGVAAGLGVVTAAVTGAVYAVAFHAPNRTQNNDYSVVKTEKIAPIYDHILSLIDDLNRVPYEPVYITSHDGCRLRGRLYDAPEGAPIAICVHGWRGTPMRDFSGGAMMLIKNGWRVLLIEQRSQGRSEGHCITFGAKERLDVRRWAQWAAQEYGSESRIMLFGISMGAASVLLASALDLPEQVRAVVADCPFSSGRDILIRTAAQSGVPKPLCGVLADLTARLWGWFDLKETDVREAVKHTRVPVLLIHGEDDDFVPPEMSEEIRLCNPTRMERHTFPGASHGISFVIGPERYEKLVTAFSARVMGNDQTAPL